MSCYFIARIQIQDAEEYQKYLEQTDQVFAKYEGTYLAVDENPAVLEGECAEGRVVIIRFPTEAACMRWYQSPEYQTILRHRLKAARCDTLLVKGLP